ncbi:major facilitator superfamily domain-containing protein [Mrakia frigida]|uniref:major facilitator superfamily domain-containing protein n=1 Tax=Mrakia frigida TaxID=29902 RepID=UPI003FCC2147
MVSKTLDKDRRSPSSSSLPPLSSSPPSMSPSPTATVVLDPPLDSKDNGADPGGLGNAGDLEDETFGAEGREKRGVGGQLDEKWDFEQHSACPYNLSLVRRWSLLFLIASTALVSTLTASMPVPSLSPMGVELGVTNPELLTTSFSIFMLGVGAGPFVFSPLSEIYGRKPMYTSTMAVFTTLNVGCALAPNFPAIFILRFLSGVFSSTGPGGVGVATVADLFPISQRGRALSLYGLTPMLGPPLGSLFGSFIDPELGWRWIYWVLAILAGANAVALQIFLQETYHPVLEARIRNPTPKLSLTESLRHVWATRGAVTSKLSVALKRPPTMLFTDGVLAVSCIYYAFIYANLFLFLVSIPILYRGDKARPPLFNYGYSEEISGLAYIGLCVGLTTGTLTTGYYADGMYSWMKARYGGGVGRPEFRLALTQIGMVIFPCGLLMYGLAAEFESPWIVPQIGMVLLGFGEIMAFSTIQGFLVDQYQPFGASAISAAVACRSVASCVLPICGPLMFSSLGYAGAVGLLAGLGVLVIGGPVGMIWYKRRERRRAGFE